MNVTVHTYNPAKEKVVPKDAVVLDMGPGVLGWTSIDYLVQALHADGFHMLADQIEAQTKPPRIPEPGWGAIVEAGVDAHDERLLWTPNDQGFWSCKNPDEYARHWQQRVDPTLIRDGIEGAS